MHRSISRGVSGSWSGGRNTPSAEQPLDGFYTGIVMDDADDQRMGQIWVYLPGVSQRRRRTNQPLPTYGGTAPDRDNSNGNIQWDQELRLGWIQCLPLLPFFGGDDYRVKRSPGGDVRSAGNGDVQSYGFFAQPRIGDEVGVLFANGDPGKGYWIGCVPKYARNAMVPGVPGRPPEDFDETQDVEDQNNPNPSVHKLTKQLKEEGMKTVEPAGIPAYDKARRLSSNKNKPVEKELVEVLAVPEQSFNVQSAGMLCDPIRGASNGSMRRESPSYVMGFKTAGWNFDSEKGNLDTASGRRVQFNERGEELEKKNTVGHAFVMDDHPDYQGIRLRTSAGSQLYFNDSCNSPFIWSNTAKGNVWIEIVDDGKINIFSEDNISVHTRQDMNLTVDRDLNIDVQRDLNVQVRRDTRFKLKGEVHFEYGKNDLPPQDLQYLDGEEPDWGDNEDGTNTKDMFIQNFGNVDWTIGNSDNNIRLDPGDEVSVNLARNLKFEVTNDVDWTIGNDLNIDVGNDVDVFIGANMRLEAVDDIDYESGGNTSFEQQGTLDILTQGAGRWTANTHDHFSTGGDFVVTASPNVHLNGPAAASANPATNPNPVEPVTEPTIPPTALIPRVPTDEEVKTCQEPPSEFRTLDRMVVPQHMPWTNVCKLSQGFKGFIDDTPVDVVRKGSTTLNSPKPLDLPEENQFKEAKPFETDNQEEEPQYEIKPPQGGFNDCETYSTSEKGLDFLHQQEGIRTDAYKDTDKWAIGYGHNINVGDVIFGDTINGRVTQADIDRLNRTKGDLNISKAEARRIFRQDLVKFEKAVCAEIDTPITQGQFDALVSYAYNGGQGAVRRMVQRSDFNSGDFSRVPQAWMRLSTASGTKDPVKRAQQEAVLRKRRRLELETLFSQPA